MYALVEGALKPVFPRRDIVLVTEAGQIRVYAVMALATNLNATHNHPTPKKLKHDYRGGVIKFYA